jgi:uncharacterized protein (DUF2141 family)
MLKKLAKAASLASVLATPLAPASASAVGPDAAACRPGANGPAVLVYVDGFRQHTGNVRVNVYGSDPAKFLARGQYVRQINLPVAQTGAMSICVALPAPGRYGVAVRHDLDGNGHSGWNDGGGFSRNPHLSLTGMRPTLATVAINVGRAPVPVDVVLNYRFGLSIHPVAG